MVVCLEQGANDLHMVQLMSLQPHPLCVVVFIGYYFIISMFPVCYAD